MKKAKNNLDACKKGTNDCSALLDDYTTAEKKYDQSVKNYKSIQGEIEKLMNTHGDLLPDQTVRFSVPYWLAFSAENDAQDQPIEFTLTFNWKQFNK